MFKNIRRNIIPLCIASMIFTQTGMIYAGEVSENEMEESMSVSEDTASDNDTENVTPTLSVNSTTHDVILNATSYSYSHIHYMGQRSTATDDALNDTNYEEVGKKELKGTFPDSGDNHIETDSIAGLLQYSNVTSKGYTKYSDQAYKYSNGAYVEIGNSGQIDAPHSAGQVEDYYLFYTNDAIWNSNNHSLRENQLNVILGDTKLKDLKIVNHTAGDVEILNGSYVPCGSQLYVYIKPDNGFNAKWSITETASGIKGNARKAAPTSGLTENKDTPFIFTMGSQLVNLTVKSAARTAYKITYDGLKSVGAGNVDAMFGGNKGNPNPTQCYDGVEYDLTAPQATGKKFVGWQVNDAGSTVIEPGDKLRNVEANRVLTALWEDAEYTLSADYIYGEEELRSDLPIDNSIIKVTLHRDNNKPDVVLLDGQYTVEKPHVEYGHADYTVKVIAETINEIENAENNTTPKSTSSKKTIDKTVKATGTVSMDATIKTIIKGEKFTFDKIAKIPGEKKVKILSTSKKVATANKKGVITGKKRPGLVTIKKTVYGQTVSGAEIQIYNEVPVYPKSIVLAKSKATKEIGLQGISGEVTYETDDPTIATVDETGLVTATGSNGSTKIIMTIHDKRYKIKVRVGKKETSTIKK